ncbi:MAG TPA: hypothetical protein VFB39_12435 [Solirubrobacteraceae bacterium]|nr:hypothetical protein [Solirubrobacteraceae bacterium]
MARSAELAPPRATPFAAAVPAPATGARGSGRNRRRAAVAAIIAVAALTAGGCGTATNPTSNFNIPNITSQDLLHQLEQPTSRGPGGYEMISGPQRLSLRGIQYTIQGREALQSWLNTPTSKRSTYQQAGRNLAIAFPQNKSEIEGKLQ